MSTIFNNPDNFDKIVYSRLLAPDFGQSQVKAFDFYKHKAIEQIEASVSAILTATNQHEFTTAIAQANAFIDAALDYEFINLCEKAVWLDKIAHTVRSQMLEEPI